MVKMDTEPPQNPRRVYVSAFIEGLDDAWPDFDKLRADGITIDSDYPFIGASRTGRHSIERDDLFLGIYGFERKGHLGDIQEKEYQMAREQGKPVLAFIHSGYLYNSPPIGVFDLLSRPQDQLTKVVSFGPHEKLEPRVFAEVRQFFANGGWFDVSDAPGAEELAPTEQNSMLGATDVKDRDSLAEAVSGKPDDLVGRSGLERAETLRAERRFVEALAEYDRFTGLFPAHANARLSRAGVLRELRRFDEALAEYKRIIEEFPESVEARIGRAEVLRDIKRLEEALVDYGWVIKARPKDEEALATYADVVREIAESGHTARAKQISENNISSAEPSELANETIPAEGSSQPDGVETATAPGEVDWPTMDRITEWTARVRDELDSPYIDSSMILVGLVDSEEDSVARAFLSSFGITREKLFKALNTHYGKVFRAWYSKPPRRTEKIGEIRSFTPLAQVAASDALKLAQAENKSEVQARHLFQALLSDSEPHEWVQTTIGKDVVDWIRTTLEDWDDATPITQAAVQAKMVEDDLFVNPPTQRDSAAEKDLLGFEEYAEALVQIIRRPETRAPLVVGVYGPWGSGKSTFMGLVKRKLDALGQPSETEPTGPGAFIKRKVKRLRGLFRKSERSLRVTTVDYDAWAYADAQKLWSGLVDKIAKELDAELTARDRIAYLINSHSRRLITAFALGLIPVALFALGYAAQSTPTWVSDALSPIWNKPWLNLPGWLATGAWGLYAYFLQRRPVTDAVASLAARFDSAPAAGLVSRIQDEFKTALQTRIDPEKKPKTVEALRTDIRQRVERNELKVVVFIDELDRCPLEKIVEILEAIKLFLAEDIFIVLLGVDTRVASEAIRLHYKDVQNPNLPREYLEKIVQLPLRVPTAGRKHIESYLESFMTLPEEGSKQENGNGHPQGSLTVQPASGASGAAEMPAHGVVARAAGAAGVAVITQDPENINKARQPTDAAVENLASEPRARTAYDASALSRSAALPQLPDTKIEFESMAAIARDFLDSNPRRIKRLLNTYRYVKILAARLPGTQVQTTSWQQTMLYWLAFTMKWPAFMGKAIEEAEKLQSKNLANTFLVERLQKGANNQAQPEVEDIEKHLSLTAEDIVEHYQLAPNFLIENPDLTQRSDTHELTAPQGIDRSN